MKAFCILNIKDNVIQNPAAWKKCYWDLKDGKYLVEINSHNKRSNPQNRYYWGLVIVLVRAGIQDLGTELTSEETHEFLKGKFNLSELVNKQTGQVEQIPLSTTRLNKEQFCQYIEKIQQFAAEFLNIIIPDPGEQTELIYD